MASLALSPDQQLALAYAKANKRQAFAALFAMDYYFTHLSLSAREPLLALIKLAWWREQGIVSNGGDWDEPLSLLRAQNGDVVASLCDLTLAWSEMLGNDPDLDAYAKLRGSALFGAAADLCGVARSAAIGTAGTFWALSELSRVHGDLDVGEGAALRASRMMPDPDLSQLRGAMRPCGVLVALAKSDVLRGRVNQYRPGSPMRMGVALRFALFG